MAGLAQNDKISYQAVVRNSANQLVYDQDLTVTVGIANSESGTAVYTETHATHSNPNGLISLLIGDGTPVSGSDWNAIQWNSAWVTAVISQGGTVLATHHLPLSAVPYALYADQVDPAALANYLTANHYLTEEVQVLSLSNDTVYLTGGSFVKLPAGFSGNYNDLTNKPDLTQYATTSALKDSLTRYVDKEKLNDTLDHYLMQEVQVLSVSNDTLYLTGGSWVKLPQGFSGDYNDLTNLPDLTQYATNSHLNDTLDHYLMQEVQVLSVSNDTLYLTGGSWVKLPQGFSGDYNDLTNLPDLTQYATNVHLNDTLNAYYDTTHYYTRTKINDTVNYILDQIANASNLSNYYTKHQVDSIAHADSLALATRMDTVYKHLCDSVMACEGIRTMRTDIDANKQAIIDSSAHIRTDIKKLDTALTKRINIVSDSVKRNLDTIRLNRQAIIDTAEHIRTDIKKLDTALTKRINIVSDSVKKNLDTIRLNRQAIIDTAEHIRTDIKKLDTALTKRIDIVSDSVKRNLDTIRLNRQAIIDTAAHIRTDIKKLDTALTKRINIVSDSVKKNLDTIRLNRQAIIDTAAHIRTDIKKLDTALTKRIDIVSDSVKRNLDTIRLNRQAIIDTASHIRTDIKKLDTALTKRINIVSDSVKKNLDTIRLNRQAIIDTAEHIRTDIKKLDTALTKRINIVSDSVKNNLDTIRLNRQAIIDTASHIRTDIKKLDTALTKRMNIVSDSVKKNLDTIRLNRQAIIDTAAHIRTDIKKLDTALTKRINIVSDSVKRNLDTIRLNRQAIIDTAEHIRTDIKKLDTALTKRMNIVSDSVKKNLDTIRLNRQAIIDTAAHIRTDIKKLDTALTKRINIVSDSVKKNLDTIRLNRQAIIDTASRIRNSIGNGAVTITRNHETINYGTFGVNQKEPQVIDIEVPTKLSQLANDGGKYAKRDSVNVFTENNTFTDTVIVPNGYVLKGENATNESNCGNIVVNACDLWAVFDSLTKRMDAMQETIEGLRDSVKTLMPKLSLVANPTSGVVCGEKPATITYTANISNGNTADYQFKWTVNGTDSTSVTGPTLTCHYTTNNDECKVVCTATSSEHLTMKDSVTISVTTGAVPDFSITADNLIVTLTTESEIDTIAWGDGKGIKSPTTFPVQNEYPANGTYTITVKSTTGCQVEKTVTVKYGISQDALTPCNVTSAHTDAATYTTTTGGLETTDDNGKVIKVQDQDGHEYFVTQIGTQCWMAENLRSKRYSSNLTVTVPAPIPINPSDYNNDYTYYGYPNNSSTNEETFGLLYNWTAALGRSTIEGNDQGLCPDGWHVPNREELNTMVINAGADNRAVKLAGKIAWETDNTPNAPGNYSSPDRNSSGFNVLPAGYSERQDVEGFGESAKIWSSTYHGQAQSGFTYENSYYYIELSYNSFGNNYFHDASGTQDCYSVRCVRDTESGGTTQTDPSVTTGVANPVGETTATLSATITNPDNVEITAKGFEYKLTSGGSYTSVAGTGDGASFTADLTGLTANTGYTYRAFITTASGTLPGEEATFTTTSAAPSTFTCGTSTVSDGYGNTYNTVQIGEQCWTKENMRSTTYSDGTAVATSGLYNPGNDAGNVADYGYLYNWNAAMKGSPMEGAQGICPTGWHVPTQTEWSTLINGRYADELAEEQDWGYDLDQGEEGAPCLPRTGKLNFTGFTALPAGTYYSSASSFGSRASFWTSTEPSSNGNFAYRCELDKYNKAVSLAYDGCDKGHGYSVRCIRDAESGGGGTTQTDPTVTTESATNITTESATLNATISNDGEVAISTKGFEYKETSSTGGYTTFTGTITETDNGFSANLTGLTSNTIYTYRAFIKIDGGNTTVTSDVEKTFTTVQTAATATSPTGNFSVNKVQSGVIRVLVENINFQGTNSKKVKVYYTNSMNVDDLAIDYWNCFGTFNRDNDDDFSCDITLPSSYVSDDMDVFVKVILESDETENDLGRKQIYPF